jgi:hypothetical protein
MRLVVADTSPLNYLVLIGQVEILPVLFQKVLVPQIVRDELHHNETPDSVRQWIATPPSWLCWPGTPILSLAEKGNRAAERSTRGYA